MVDGAHEVWLDFRVTSHGDGYAKTVLPFTPVHGARSVVIHEMATNHHTGAAGARAGLLPGGLVMRTAMGRAGLAGLLVGAGWGIAARGWMRLVSREPEFSGSGTLLIVAISAVLGLGMGVSVVARHTTGWRRWMRLAVVPGMLLFAGQGAPFLPAFIVAGPLLRRRSRIAGIVAGTALVAPALLVWWSERFRRVHHDLGTLAGPGGPAGGDARAGHGRGVGRKPRVGADRTPPVSPPRQTGPAGAAVVTPQPRGARRAGLTGGNPLIEGALRLVVGAPARARRGAGLEVGKWSMIGAGST